MTDRAATISMKVLSEAVAKAVSADHAAKFAAGSAIANHNLIMGRWLDAAISTQEAGTLAHQLTSEVQKTLASSRSAAVEGHSALQPAFMGLGGRILIGFVANQQIALGE